MYNEHTVDINSITTKQKRAQNINIDKMERD